jgi:hypothetical protein
MITLGGTEICCLASVVMATLEPIFVADLMEMLDHDLLGLTSR